MYRYGKSELDGCIVWNVHDTVFGSKRSAICAQPVYFLRQFAPLYCCF